MWKHGEEVENKKKRRDWGVGEVREMEVNMLGEWRVHGKRKQKRQEGQEREWCSREL